MNSKVVVPILISAVLIVGMLVYVSTSKPQVPGGWEMWSKDVGAEVGAFMSSDGSYVLAVTRNMAYLFRRASDEPIWSRDIGENIFTASISSDGSYMAIGTRGADSKVFLFSKSKEVPIWISRVSNARFSSTQVSISADGSYVAADGEDREGISSIYLFSTSDNVPLWSYRTDNLIHIGISVSSDGSYVAAGTYDGSVYLFSRARGEPLWKYKIGGAVNHVSISADGSYIVAGSLWPDNSLYLFSRENAVPLWSYRTGPVIYTGISSDGNYVAARSTGESRKLWFFSKSDNTLLWTFDGVDHFSISSDGSRIVAGGIDGKIYLLSKPSAKPIWSYQTGGKVRAVAISSDGRCVAAGSEDHKLYFFRQL